MQEKQHEHWLSGGSTFAVEKPIVQNLAVETVAAVRRHLRAAFATGKVDRTFFVGADCGLPVPAHRSHVQKRAVSVPCGLVGSS